MRRTSEEALTGEPKVEGGGSDMSIMHGNRAPKHRSYVNIVNGNRA